LAGTTANQLAINSMAKSLQDAGYQPGSPEFATLLKMGSAALGLAVGGDTGSSVAEAATQYNWLLHSEVEDADKRRAACANQACKDKITAEMEMLSLSRDHEREVFSNNAFAQIAKAQGGLTYSDRDYVANAYYAQYGLKPGESIAADYAPAYELGYQFRQVVAGFSGARDSLSATLEHYQANPTEIPGAVVNGVYENGKSIITGTVTYLSSDVPAWTLSNQVADAYGPPTAANTGAFLYGALIKTGLAAGGAAAGSFESAAGWPVGTSGWNALATPGSAAYTSQLGMILSDGGLAASGGSSNLALALALGGASNTNLVVGGIGGVTGNGVAGSIREVNPGFPADGRSRNCVNCSIATDATLAGNPASALPNMSNDGVPISVLEMQFGTKFSSSLAPSDIVAQMAGAGSGARGIVFGSNGPGEVGHVFNVVNQGGVVRFLDGQTGAVADMSKFQTFQLLRTNP
jgi:filamentous hemagglutinin